MVEFWNFLVRNICRNTVSIAKEISETLELLKSIYLVRKFTMGQTDIWICSYSEDDLNGVIGFYPGGRMMQISMW